MTTHNFQTVIFVNTTIKRLRAALKSDRLGHTTKGRVLAKLDYPRQVPRRKSILNVNQFLKGIEEFDGRDIVNLQFAKSYVQIYVGNSKGKFVSKYLSLDYGTDCRLVADYLK